jgi:hypothetical protein
MHRSNSSLSILMVMIIVGSLTTVTALAAPESFAASTFDVTFDGLIVHFLDLNPRHPQRALVVQGGAGDMLHVPLLITDTDIDTVALAKTTGQPVYCGTAQGDNRETCRVVLDGIDMRIVGVDESPIITPLFQHASFVELTPHLSKVTKGTILSSISGSVPDDLPTPPIAAFIELTGGTLSACAFGRPAFFVPDLDSVKENNRFFAEIVTLTGSVSPTVKAVLQIRSKATSGVWTTISHSSDSSLSIRIDNHAPRQNGMLKATTSHFALFKSVLMNVPDGGFPVVCPAPYTVGTDEFEILCAIPANQPAASKFMPQPNKKVCESFASAQALSDPDGPAPALELLPGCANSTWP